MAQPPQQQEGRRPLPDTIRFAVLGGGSFGLGLACVVARKSIPVTVLVRKQEVADHINTHHEHPTYLKDIELPPCIHATTDPDVRRRRPSAPAV